MSYTGVCMPYERMVRVLRLVCACISQDECPEHVSKLIEACLNPHRYLRPTAKGCADFLASLPA